MSSVIANAAQSEARITSQRSQRKDLDVGLLRLIASPIRNYLNNHFEMVKEEVRQQHSVGLEDLGSLPAQIGASAAAMNTAFSVFGATNAESQQLVARQLVEIRQHGQLSTEVAELVLAELKEFGNFRLDLAEAKRMAAAVEGSQSALEGLQSALEGSQSALASKFEEWFRRLDEEQPLPARIAEVGSRDAELLNRMNAHDGFLAQAGLWINDPLSSGFEGGTIQLNDVNERIGELPYVFAASRTLDIGSRVLDVGCCESVVSVSLASVGYRVTALDPRPYPFAHPMLTVETKPVERFFDAEGFDMIILLSTIEHLGVGSYGLDDGERSDLVAMRHLRTLLRDGGRLVLTTPFGFANVNELERTYDVAGVRRLIAGFELVEEPTVLVRQSRTEWTTDPRGFTDVLDERQRVVMLTARGDE